MNLWTEYREANQFDSTLYNSFISLLSKYPDSTLICIAVVVLRVEIEIKISVLFNFSILILCFNTFVFFLLFSFSSKKFTHLLFLFFFVIKNMHTQTNILYLSIIYKNFLLYKPHSNVYSSLYFVSFGILIKNKFACQDNIYTQCVKIEKKK